MDARNARNAPSGLSQDNEAFGMDHDDPEEK
jgi:hypothetical protein